MLTINQGNLYLSTNLKSRVTQSKTQIFSDNLNLTNDTLNNKPVKTVRYTLFPTESRDNLCKANCLANSGNVKVIKFFQRTQLSICVCIL